MVGKVKKYQQGGLWANNKKGFVDSVLNSNKDKEWVRRLYDKNPESINVPGEKYPSTHYMESGEADGNYYAYPTIQKIGKSQGIEYLGPAAFNYSLEHGTAIPFKTNEQAEWFANNGYKIGTGVNTNLKKQQGGKVSIQGYKRQSKDRKEPILTIPGQNISMSEVPHPVMAYPQQGQPTMMYPGNQYSFPNSQYVDEVPIRQYGGNTINNTIMKKQYQGQYDMMQTGGQAQPAGMYWDGKQYRKVTPAIAAGSMYKQGGPYPGAFQRPQQSDEQIPTLIPAQYQQWATGGQYTDLPTMIPAQYQQWQYGGDTDVMKTGGIHIKSENKGKFTAYKARTGKTTQEALHSSDPHVRKMANFARNAAKWHHQNGGPVQYQGGGPYDRAPIPGEVTDQYNQQVAQHPPVVIDNSQQPVVSPQYPIQAPVVQDAPMAPTDNSQQPQHPAANKRRPWTDPFGTILSAGLVFGSYVNSQNNAESVHKAAQSNGLTGAGGWGMQQGNEKGDYDPNHGYFRPSSNTPTRAGTFYPTMKNGGQYTKDTVYDLDHSTIQSMIKQGYEIEYL